MCYPQSCEEDDYLPVATYYKCPWGYKDLVQKKRLLNELNPPQDRFHLPVNGLPLHSGHTSPRFFFFQYIHSNIYIDTHTFIGCNGW